MHDESKVFQVVIHQNFDVNWPVSQIEVIEYLLNFCRELLLLPTAGVLLAVHVLVELLLEDN